MKTNFNQAYLKFSILTGARLLGAFFAFASNLLIARYLGAQMLGQYSLLLSIAMIFAVVASLGFPGIGTIYSARYLAKKQWGLIKGFQRTGIKLTFIASIFFGVTAAFYYLYWYKTLTSQTLILSFLIANFILSTALLNLNTSILVGLNRQIAALLPETLLKPILFIISSVAVFAFGYTISIEILFANITLATYFALIVTFISFGQIKPFKTVTHQNLPNNRWLKAAYPWVVTSIIWNLFIELHIILASFLFAPAQVGILHIVFRLRMLAGFGMRALYMLFIPKIVTAHSQNKPDDMHLNIRHLNLLTITYALACLIGFGLLGKLILNLFGDGFITGYFALLVVTSTMLFRAIMGPAGDVLSMHHYQKTSAIVMAFALITSIGLSLMLYQDFGLLGIAIAYTMANMLAAVILWFIALKKTGINTFMSIL